MADTIDPNKAHGRAMKLLEDAGIYVVAVCIPSTSGLTLQGKD